MTTRIIPPSDLAAIQRAYDATRAAFARSPMTRIITRYIYPPIPIRTSDWCAYYDGEEEYGRCGYGRTEQEAITDLLENYDDPADDRSIGMREGDIEGRT